MLEVAKPVRPGRDDRDAHPRLRPRLPLEVLRRQLDARVRVARAARRHADAPARCSRSSRPRRTGCPELVVVPSHAEGRRRDRADAALRHLADPGRPARAGRVARRHRRLAARARPARPLFGNHEALNDDVAAAMEPPLPAVELSESVETVFTRSLRAAPPPCSSRTGQAGRRPHPRGPARVPRPRATLTRLAAARRARRLRPGLRRPCAPRARRRRRGGDPPRVGIQLDSITAVARSHRITLGARVGTYPAGTVSQLLSEGRVFEHWGHEACLIPIEDFAALPPPDGGTARAPLVRRRDRRRPGAPPSGCSAEIRERGPMASREFEGKPGKGMWNYKPGEADARGAVVGGRAARRRARRNFERLYDLPERVLPPEVLDAPMPDEATYLRDAGRSRGPRPRRAHRLGDRRALAIYRRHQRGSAPHLDALVETGELAAARGRRRRRAALLVPGAEPDDGTRPPCSSPRSTT